MLPFKSRKKKKEKTRNTIDLGGIFVVVLGTHRSVFHDITFPPGTWKDGETSVRVIADALDRRFAFYLRPRQAGMALDREGYRILNINVKRVIS